VTAQASIPGERDHPSLALVNSRHNSRTGPVDHLATPEELGEWLAWRSLIARAGAPDNAERAASPGRAAATPSAATPTDADLTAAHALRDAVRELLIAAIDGRSPAPSAVTAVNDASALAPAADRLRWDTANGPVRMRSAAGAGEIERALATLAEDAIRLVCGERRADLIACEAPGCVRLLLKDHPRRHWCSTRCGDRVRAARHYRRARERTG
jgi:predicted RNA-binding Zn ribbon-like protein